MRPIAAVSLVLLLAAFGSPLAVADEKEDKLKEDVHAKMHEFRTAFAEKKIDDALKAAGTPFTLGTFTKYKTYQKAEDLKAALKAAAPGNIPWDSKDGFTTNPLSLKELANDKAYKNLKTPVGTILGKNPGYVSITETNEKNITRTAVFVIAIKDGKPQVVALLIQ